jgi:hypothetical protein
LHRRRSARRRRSGCARRRRRSASPHLANFVSDKACQLFRRLSFALPDNHYFPFVSFQGSDGSSVALHIETKLLSPELRRWWRSLLASGMTMPKASVNKHNGPTAWKDQIRRAWEVSSMQPKSKPQSVRGFADRNFGRGVLAADPRHQPRAPLARETIDHVTPPRRLRRPASNASESAKIWPST